MGCKPCSSPDPPQAPPPSETAAAQTQSNLQTAIANARLNRVNQTTPWGSINYTEGPPDANGVPTWSSNIQLSPEQQRLLQQQQGLQLSRGDIAQNLMGQVGGSLGRPLDLSSLHAINDRGSQYRGAINAPPMMSDNARMMQGIQGAAGQMGNSMMGAATTAGGPMAQLMQILMSNPQLLQALKGSMGGNGGAPQGGPGMTQASPMGGMPQVPAQTGMPGPNLGSVMGAPMDQQSRLQKLADMVRQ